MMARRFERAAAWCEANTEVPATLLLIAISVVLMIILKLVFG